MKKIFLFFGLYIFISINTIGASTSSSYCGGRQAGKWFWKNGCVGCVYHKFTKYAVPDAQGNEGSCEKFEESSDFLCRLRCGNCNDNGRFGLQGSTGSSTAFFNLREKPTKKYAPSLQTRSSAISITENDFLNLIQPNKIQTTISFDPTQSVTFGVGTADATNPQTWTIPTLSDIINGKELLYFVSPSSLPSAAQVTGATHVGKKEIVDEEKNILTEYTHFKFEAGQDLEEMGSSFVNQNDGTITNRGESTAQIYADSPLDLGDDFTTEVTEYYDDDEILPFDVTSTHVTVDAFGTINNPYTGTTYNCLRMTLEETVDEYITDENTPNNTTTQRYYMWVTKEGFRFMVKDPCPCLTPATTVTGMSMVTFSNATSLDVELLDFQGIAKDKGVDLTWTTANETNNKGFDIERSYDGKKFEKIGFVKGNGTTRIQQNYTFTDEKPLYKITYYRLQQIDFDESKVYSNIIAIEPNDKGKMLKVYPNPTDGSSITLEIPENTEGVQILNNLGQILYTKKTETSQTVQLDISKWTQGVYFVKSGKAMVKFVKH